MTTEQQPQEHPGPEWVEQGDEWLAIWADSLRRVLRNSPPPALPAEEGKA